MYFILAGDQKTTCYATKRLPFSQLNEQKLGLAILSNVFSHKVPKQDESGGFKKHWEVCVCVCVGAGWGGGGNRVLESIL